MRVTDVLCLSAFTIRGLVHEWLDAEGLNVRPGREWVRQSSCLQEANTHRLFIKL